MPKRNKHLEVGLLIGVVVIVAILVLSDNDRRIRLTELIGIGAGVLTGAVLPDEIEPAETPNHRDTAHSLVALYGSGHATLAPPKPLVDLRQGLRERADELHARQTTLPDSHQHQLRLSLGRSACYFAAGFSWGLPVGYTSHLIADMGTSPLSPV